MATRKEAAVAVVRMRHARIETAAGILEGEYDDDDGTVHTDDGTYVPEEYDLLAPCEPSALYCTGRNYDETIDQMGYETPDDPTFFIKPPVSLHPPERPIPYPEFSSELTYAGELAAVIGTECKGIEEGDVDDVVRGYTILNDLDCLDQESLSARKAFDASGPLGPVIADIEPVGVEMTTHIDGELRQEDTTESMLIKPRQIVSFLSDRVTLKPGDVVSFGSPANPGLLERGDEIEIHYEGIGTLRNAVA
jgi:2-keto-4-pentenoate hydratase/2-oxohepta-3-ene-1,7-dioic acid hydratase in catechol pathway